MPICCNYVRLECLMQEFEAIRARIEQLVQFLPDKPEETAESTARALWWAAAGFPKSAELSKDLELPELSADAVRLLQELLARRVAGTPLSHITGRQRFMGMEMLAGPDALVPRKETELLGITAIALTDTLLDADHHPLVIDVCTGSGNIALAIADRFPSMRVFGADLSDQAVALARQNAKHLGLDSRVDFRTGDLLAPFESIEFLGQVDLLTCNPPYINSGKVGTMPKEISDYEPRLAFDGGSLGISILMKLIQNAPRFLRKGGWLAFEVGAGQGPAIEKRLRSSLRFSEVRSSKDSAGVIRVLMAQC